MKKLEGEPAGIECLSGQVDQYRGVCPDGIKKYGIFKLADGIPENVTQTTGKTPWYQGDHLLSILETLDSSDSRNLRDFRLSLIHI